MSPINTANPNAITIRQIDEIDWTSLSANPYAITILDSTKYYIVIDRDGIVLYDRVQYNGPNQDIHFTFTCNGFPVQINNISNYRFIELVN